MTRASGCVWNRSDNYPVNVEVVGEGEVVHVSFDGAEIDLHIVHALRGALDQMGIPEVMLEQAAAALQQELRNDPMTFLYPLRGQGQGQGQ